MFSGRAVKMYCVSSFFEIKVSNSIPHLLRPFYFTPVPIYPNGNQCSSFGGNECRGGAVKSDLTAALGAARNKHTTHTPAHRL